MKSFVTIGVMLALSACFFISVMPNIYMTNPRKSMFTTPAGRIYTIYVDQPEVVGTACEDARRAGCVKVWANSMIGEVWMIDNRQVEDHECAHVIEFDKPWTPELLKRETEYHTIILFGSEPVREKPCQK
jgi:hypothetical protein